MSNRDTGASRWAEALVEHSRQLLAMPAGAGREQLRGRIWEILSHALMRALRRHSSTVGQLGEDDLRDLAAEKALDLLRRIDQGVWTPHESELAQGASFVSRVARNGLIDAQRRHGRLVRPIDMETDYHEAIERQRGPAPPPAAESEQEDFVNALLECSEGLKPRSRHAWFLRVCYEMSSANIGAHPEVDAKATNVDMMISRARDQVSACLKRKGFGRDDVTPGSFVALWRGFQKSEHASLDPRGKFDAARSFD